MIEDTIVIPLASEEATHNLAQRLEPCLKRGSCVLLSGDIGAGKSFLARSIIRQRFDAEIDVPSPTFTLVQTYDHPDADIWHCDLYRLASIDEVLELGLEEAMHEEICLIEWPDRLGTLAPHDAIKILMENVGEAHAATITGPVGILDQLKPISSHAQ